MSQSATEQEIQGQARAWASVLEEYQGAAGPFRQAAEAIGEAEVVFVGAGTSWYLSLAAASVYTQITGLPACAVPPSDLILFPEAVLARTRAAACVFVSRSGTTTETIRAARAVASRPGTVTVAVTCNREGDLQQACQHALVADVVNEKSVVMTQSFSTMVLLTQLLAATKADDTRFLEELSRLPALGEAVLQRSEPVASELARDDRFCSWVYLGQGPYYGLACEGMLKLTEMSLTDAKAFHTLEYRHGPKSMMDERGLAVCLVSETGRRLEAPLVNELQGLGGTALVVCEQAGDDVGAAAHVLELNSGLSDCARLALYMPLLHYLGLHRAVSKGLNPDAPKNLTQVVVLPDTV